MTKTFHVLIVEDESTTVELYQNALNHVQNHSTLIVFNVETAQDCPSAYDKINRAIKGSPYDLVFLDIRLPSTNGHNIKSGEDLGLLIRKEMPSARIIVITHDFEPSLLKRVYKNIRPDSFVVKNDINGINDLYLVIEKVIDNHNFFSNRVLTMIKQQATNRGVLNDYEIKILLEISNGAKMKELLQLLPLGESSINKHRSHIKETFGDRSMNDRDMILIAKERGFI